MNSKKIAEFKTKLLKEKGEVTAILRNIAVQTSNPKSPTTTFEVKEPEFGEVADLEEEADEVEEYGSRLALEKVLSRRLKDIDEALERIDTDKFGFCQKCNKEIEEKLLEIDPESKYCKTCKGGMSSQ